MGISYVQQQSTRANNVTSVTVTISAAAGSLLAVAVMPSGGSSSVPISSVTDSSGANSWNWPTAYPSTNPPANNDGGGDGVAICWSSITHAVTSVTVNVPSSCAALTAIVTQFTGVATSGAFVSGGQATSTSTPTLSITGGNLAIGAMDSSNATSVSGMTSILVTHGNGVGYVVPSSTSNESMSWSPSQTAASVIAQFKLGVINGTATLTDSESLTANATVGATASLIETESLTAVPGANPHIAFSAVVPNQNDPNGIPLQYGLAAYNYTSSTATTYDHWIALQNGQLASGPYNTNVDTFLKRTSAGLWVVGNAVQFTDETAPSTPSGGGVIYSHQGVPTWKDTGGQTLGMVRAYSAHSTSNLTMSLTEADVPGATVSVVVTGSNATIFVVTNFDFSLGTGSTAVGQFSWNGSDQTSQAIFVTASTVTGRGTVGQNYVITGITAGTYTAKLTGKLLGGTGTAEQSHTGLSVMLIDQ